MKEKKENLKRCRFINLRSGLNNMVSGPISAASGHLPEISTGPKKGTGKRERMKISTVECLPNERSNPYLKKKRNQMDALEAVEGLLK